MRGPLQNDPAATPRRAGRIARIATAGAVAVPSGALAQDEVLRSVGSYEVVTLAALIGVVSFAVMSAVALMRARNRAERENEELRKVAADLASALDRADAIRAIDDQRLVVWEAAGEAPVVIGRLRADSAAPEDPTRFPAFGTWLAPQSAAALDRAIEKLRERGEAFALALAVEGGGFVEAAGRAAGARAIVRFRDLTGERHERAELAERHAALERAYGAMRAMLDILPAPVWLRDREGRLAWVNRAYAAAVDAADASAVVSGQIELLDTPVRRELAERPGGPLLRRTVPAVIGGARRMLDLMDYAGPESGGGIATDVSELEEARATLKRLAEFHARTLDQLAAGVAIFGPDRRLRSYNAAYRGLFDLDTQFLDTGPDEAAVLDRLRATRKLPEQADFRSWKEGLLSAYRSLEASEHLWHLPDGQTLRVIASPHPEGGMTWIYENVTERIDLEARYNALIRVQGETLDHLTEGVAVFGSDGRLRLNNPSFAAIWRIPEEELAERPHVARIVAACRRLHEDEAVWRGLTASVAGVDETRASHAGRVERADGRVIDYATVPLPDGQTMLTFVDVTDSVQVERALVDRNEALEAADRLKNAFIQRVSYELRSPLTNIIGFTQLLADARIGELNAKQREYVDYIMSSSGTLLAIVNDILDLATIDAGIIELELGEVDIAATVAAAIEGVGDRMKERRVTVENRVPPMIGTIRADERRLRQILFNLLSNGVGYSPDGGRVRIAAERRSGAVVFTVADEGAGMPTEFVKDAFGRFESRQTGGRRGAGLGLAIVKSFVELHRGSVDIESEVGRGTVVTVRLPLDPEAVAEAAE